MVKKIIQVWTSSLFSFKAKGTQIGTASWTPLIGQIFLCVFFIDYSSFLVNLWSIYELMSDSHDNMSECCNFVS